MRLGGTSWIVFAAAIAALAACAGIAWAHHFIANSHVTIEYVGHFDGKVSSKQGSCERNRKVTVRRVVSGPDPSYGSDLTDRFGNWTVNASADIAGFYYAQASFRRVRKPGHDHICLAARSDEISIG
jgi:hypothetical protein